MSYFVVRFGGNRIPEDQFILRFPSLLETDKGTKIVVVSAHAAIAETISGAIIRVIHTKPDLIAIEAGLNGTFSEITGNKPSTPYLNSVHALIKLLRGIHLTGDYSPALKDQVLSFSEILTAELLHERLRLAGIPAKTIRPDEIGLEVTSDFGSATYTGLEKEKISQFDTGSVLILPGSSGITASGKIARAGVSAADYTAAAITAFLNVPALVLWGIDKPFLNADPRIVDGALQINRLTYSEASELAYFDHYSFHPRTVELLEPDHIPIRIYNSDLLKPETIINTETFVTEQIVKSVACSDDISVLKLDGPGVGLKPGILARVTTCLHEAGINIRSVITSQVSINFILGRGCSGKALELVNQLGFTSVKNITAETGVSLIGVIGHGMQHHYGVFAKVFTAAANGKVNILLSGSGASDLSGYLIVSSADRDQCVREIHHAFFNNQTITV